MPTSVVDPAFDLLSITRTGALANVIDSGTDFNFDIIGNYFNSWASDTFQSFNYAGLLGSNTYILEADVDWPNLLIEIPDGSQIFSVEISVLGAVALSATVNDQADLFNLVLTGHARCRGTLSVEANLTAYVPTSVTGWTDDVETISTPVPASSYTNLIQALTEPNLSVEKVWDFTGDPINFPLGYIEKADLISNFTSTQIKMTGVTAIGWAQISGNSHTGNATETFLFQTTQWEMRITWQVSYVVDLISPDPVVKQGLVTITGTDLDAIVTPTIEWTDADGDLQSRPITFLTQTPTEITFNMPDTGTYMGLVTIFSGAVSLGTLTVYVATGSGIYRIVKDKRNDTLYDRATSSTEDVTIPRAFGKTGWIGG